MQTPICISRKWQKEAHIGPKKKKSVYLVLKSNAGHPDTLKYSFLLHLSSPGALLGWSSLGSEVFVVGVMQQAPTSWSCQHACCPFWGRLLTPTCLISEFKPEGSSGKLACRRRPLDWPFWDVSPLFLIAQQSNIRIPHRERKRSVWEKVREIKTTSPVSWKRTASPKAVSKHLISWPHLCIVRSQMALKGSPHQNMR